MRVKRKICTLFYQQSFGKTESIHRRVAKFLRLSPRKKKLVLMLCSPNLLGAFEGITEQMMTEKENKILEQLRKRV